MKEELIFAGILLLSQASPGPDQAFVTRSTLAYGFGAGVMAALGIGTGIVAHAALACTVGASVFHSPLGLGAVLRRFLLDAVFSMENMAEGEECFPCRVRGYSPGFLYLP